MYAIFRQIKKEIVMKNMNTAQAPNAAIPTETPAHGSSKSLNLEPHRFMDVKTATFYHLVNKRTGCAVAEWQMTNCRKVLTAAFNRLLNKTFGYELCGYQLEVLQ
jgi:hypothetical protein